MAEENEVAEPTLHGEHVYWQVTTPPTHQPPGAKKAKDELTNRRTREQVARVQAQASLEMA